MEHPMADPVNSHIQRFIKNTQTDLDPRSSDSRLTTWLIKNALLGNDYDTYDKD